MNQDERESIIEQLCLITGYRGSVYETKSDDYLQRELAKYYGNENNRTSHA